MAVLMLTVLSVAACGGGGLRDTSASDPALRRALDHLSIQFPDCPVSHVRYTAEVRDTPAHEVDSLYMQLTTAPACADQLLAGMTAS
jgi:hypothetical protein